MQPGGALCRGKEEGAVGGWDSGGLGPMGAMTLLGGGRGHRLHGPRLACSPEGWGWVELGEGLLTAGLSSDTPRRHSTSPLSLTAQSAML